MKKHLHPNTMVVVLLALILGISGCSAGTGGHGTDAGQNENPNIGALRFAIAVIPDTQNYVNNTKSQPSSNEDFIMETTYLAANKEALGLAFVTHVGDIVEHGDGTKGTGDRSYGGAAEWDRALYALKILADAEIPFGLTPGNHDYDNSAHTTGDIPLTSNVMWSRYFGSRSWLFAFKPWYGGASDQLSYNPGLSSSQTFNAGGRYFLHISLQMEPSDEALNWAQGVINAHPGYATIISTHSYISPPSLADDTPPLLAPATRNEASYLTTAPGTCSGAPQGRTSPGGCNNAQQVWDKFIKNNDGIFMVLCGHSWVSAGDGVSKGENIRIDNNLSGHPVYQVLSDMQGNTIGPDGVVDSDPGGEGWIRLMEFDMKAGTIHFRTYSPLLHKYAGLNENTFGQLAEFSDFTLPSPIQVLSAALTKSGAFN